MDWTFDIKTAVITAIFLPLMAYLGKILLRHLKEWCGYVLEGSLQLVGRHLKRGVAAKLSLSRYCRVMLDGNSKYLRVPARVEVTLDTDSVYIPLAFDQYGTSEPISLSPDILPNGSRMRIIGDPGSGKSSLVKYLLRRCCKDAASGYPMAKLPVLIELKTLEIPDGIEVTGLGEWLRNSIRQRLALSSAFDMASCFDLYVATSGLLLLLDGMDEVASSQYQRTATAINQLSEWLALMSNGNVVILTMRTQFHLQIAVDFENYFPQALYVKPFSPTDIFEFLRRWPFRHNHERNVTRIFSDLTDVPTLREMCSNPLVLAMYVAEDQSGGTDERTIIPETRTEFYSDVTEELMIRRRIRQVGSPESRTRLKQQREQIIGRIALDHMCNPDESPNAISWDSAVSTVAAILMCDPDVAVDTLRELSRETGLFSEERSGESLRFIHLTFCEFLAATEAIQGRRNGFEHLFETHVRFSDPATPFLHARLQEVLPFACGLLPRIERQQAILRLWELGDSNLLLRSFLETKEYQFSVWPELVEVERSYLLSVPEQSRDDAWLRRLYLFSVVLRDAEHSGSAVLKGESGKLFHDLLGQQHVSLERILSAFATQDAAAAFRVADLSGIDLAESFREVVIKHCDQPPFLALIRERASQEAERMSVWACLLSEAALRSKATAYMMSNLPVPKSWRGTLASIPHRKRWIPVGGRDSFLAAAFSLCLLHPQDGLSSTGLTMSLPVLQKLSRNPLLRVPGVAFGIIEMGIVLSFFGLVFAAATGDVPQTSGRARLALYILGGVYAFILTPAGIYRHAFANAYAWLTGLPSWSLSLQHLTMLQLILIMVKPGVLRLGRPTESRFSKTALGKDLTAHLDLIARGRGEQSFARSVGRWDVQDVETWAKAQGSGRTHRM
jgi:hypothetical protein